MPTIRKSKRSSKFKKDWKKYKDNIQNQLEFHKVYEILINAEVFPQRYDDHELIGNYKDHRECHIRPDLLLIYKLVDSNDIDEETGKKIIYLHLVRIGSHSELFR